MPLSFYIAVNYTLSHSSDTKIQIYQNIINRGIYHFKYTNYYLFNVNYTD